VELIPQDNEASLNDIEKHWWIVATDVIRAPWGASGSFISRWLWLQDLYVNKKPFLKDKGRTTYGSWPFVLQEYLRLDDPKTLELLRDAREGIVLQGLTAPPGTVKAQAGTAHYVKRRYTVDVRGVKGIEERDVDTGEFLRHRPDKKSPNPPLVVKRIRTAVKYDDVFAYIFCQTVGAFGHNSIRIAENIQRQVPLSSWERADLLWAYDNRHKPQIVSVYPGLTNTLDSIFPSICANHAQKIISSENGADAIPVLAKFSSLADRRAYKKEDVVTEEEKPLVASVVPACEITLDMVDGTIRPLFKTDLEFFLNYRLGITAKLPKYDWSSIIDDADSNLDIDEDMIVC